MGSFVVAHIPSASAGAWLGIVVGSAVCLGALSLTLKRGLEYLVGITIGVVCATLFIVYVVGDAFSSKWAIYVVAGIIVVLSVVLTKKAYHEALVFATALVGGTMVLLGVSHFARDGSISLYGVFYDPNSLIRCASVSCWLGFILGGCTTFLGICIQIFVLGKKQSSKSKATKMRKAHEAARKRQEKEFSKQLRDIRRRNLEEQKAQKLAYASEIEHLKKEKLERARKHESTTRVDARLEEINTTVNAAVHVEVNREMSHERARLQAQLVDAREMAVKMARLGDEYGLKKEELIDDLFEAEVTIPLAPDVKASRLEAIDEARQKEHECFVGVGTATGIIEAVEIELCALDRPDFSLERVVVSAETVIDPSDVRDVDHMDAWDKFDYYAYKAFVRLKRLILRLSAWMREEYLVAKENAADASNARRERRVASRKVEVGNFRGSTWSERFVKEGRTNAPPYVAPEAPPPRSSLD